MMCDINNLLMIILPYKVVDMRYHTGDDYQVMFATNDRWEAIEAAKDAGSKATVIKVNDDGFETVILLLIIIPIWH